MAKRYRPNAELGRLHPAIRDKVAAIQEALNAENIPLRVFEASRSPERQEYLWRKGRYGSTERQVTWVRPWKSMHQYGLAVDFVAFENGRWSWDDSGDRGQWWARMHELAKEVGMTPLYNRRGQLIEQPHVQLVGVRSSDLYQGVYPPDGDAEWADTLMDYIERWSGSPAAPPPPDTFGIRPPVGDAMPDDASDEADVPAPAMIDPYDDLQFARLNTFIRGLSDGITLNPDQAGRTVRMGITIDDLASHRGIEVSDDDFLALTREEADRVLYARYYQPCRCAEMPERTAMVVYHGAVLHGTRQSVAFLQTAFNSTGMTVDGDALEVDGIIGRLTMAAAKQSDGAHLAEAYLEVQEAHLRAHEDFDALGDGLLGRMASLRTFVNTLDQGAGKRPKKTMKVTEKKLDIDLGDVLPIGLALATGGKSAAAIALVRQILRRKASDSADKSMMKEVLKTIAEDKLDLPKGTIDIGADADAAKVENMVTPINGALGQGLGRLLNGKKTVTGILGTIATVLGPKIFPNGTEAQFLDVAFQSGSNELYLVAFVILILWGFFGKIEKSIVKASQ